MAKITYRNSYFYLNYNISKKKIRITLYKKRAMNLLKLL